MKIPPEILQQIVGHLADHNGVESKLTQIFRNLKSCILVNSEWCNSAMPLLWKQPFHRCSKSRSISLIQTLLSCLNEEELINLIRHGFPLPESFCEFKEKFPQSIYNYTSFLKNLDFYYLIGFVKNWCNYHTEDEEYDDDNQVVILLRTLLNRFAESSSGLSSLSIRSNSVDDNKYMILLEPNLYSLIKPLKTLTISCQFSMDSLISGISKNCKNLKTLKISNLNYEEEKGTLLTAIQLGCLIENQKSLECLQFNRCKSAINILIPSILKQRRVLKNMIFQSVDFDGIEKLDILRNSKLELLKIDDSYNIDYNTIQPLLISNHRKLKTVEIFHCKPETINKKLEEWALVINNRRKRRYL